MMEPKDKSFGSILSLRESIIKEEVKDEEAEDFIKDKDKISLILPNT